MSDPAWRAAKPLLLEVLADDLRSPAYRAESASHRRGALARHLAWLAADDPDLLTVEIALSEDEVLRYLATDGTQRRHSHRSRVALRSLLRSFRAAYPDAYFGTPTPARNPAEPRLPPVEDWQFDLALEICDTFRDPTTRAHCRATLLLTRSAGLDGADLRWTTGGDISRRPQAGTWVTVRAPGRNREIPVLARYADRLEDLAIGRPDRCLTSNVHPPTQSNAASVLTGLVNRNLRRHGHRFTVSPERLRKAWLVEQIGSNTPICTLLAAAGLTSTRAIDDLLEHAPMPPTVPAHLAYELGGLTDRASK